jgi:hypothetical protein
MDRDGWAMKLLLLAVFAAFFFFVVLPWLSFELGRGPARPQPATPQQPAP